MPLVLLVDSKEQKQVDKLFALFEKKGYCAEKADLKAGDYVFAWKDENNDGDWKRYRLIPDIMIERKTVDNLQKSFVRKSKAHPGFNQMEVQLFKMAAVEGMKRMSILVEDSPSRVSKTGVLPKWQCQRGYNNYLGFVDNMEDGNYPGFDLIRTNSTGETYKKLLSIYVQLNASILQGVMSLASIPLTTIAEMNERVVNATKSPLLQYYTALLSTDLVGHITACQIIDEYPTISHFQQSGYDLSPIEIRSVHRNFWGAKANLQRKQREFDDLATKLADHREYSALTILRTLEDGREGDEIPGDLGHPCVIGDPGMSLMTSCFVASNDDTGGTASYENEVSYEYLSPIAPTRLFGGPVHPSYLCRASSNRVVPVNQRNNTASIIDLTSPPSRAAAIQPIGRADVIDLTNNCNSPSPKRPRTGRSIKDAIIIIE